MMLQDADVSTDLSIRPGQVVRVNGDTSLAQPPLWGGGGGFVVQERGALSLTHVGLLGGAVSVAGGGSASLSAMTVSIRILRQCQYQLSGAGSTLQLSGVTVPDFPGGGTELTATATVKPDGVTIIYDPPTAFSNAQVSSIVHPLSASLSVSLS